MMHEHQSPAREAQDGMQLDPASTIWYYKRAVKGWDEKMIRSQILDVYNVNTVSNFSKFDANSIMVYPVPKEITVGRVKGADYREHQVVFP